MLLLTETLLFVGKSTYIIIHNNLQAKQPETSIPVIGNEKAIIPQIESSLYYLHALPSASRKKSQSSLQI